MSAQHTEEGGGSGSALLSLPLRLGAPLWSRRVRWIIASCHCTYAQRPNTGSEWPCSVASSTWSLKAVQLTCVVCSHCCVGSSAEWNRCTTCSHPTTQQQGCTSDQVELPRVACSHSCSLADRFPYYTKMTCSVIIPDNQFGGITFCRSVKPITVTLNLGLHVKINNPAHWHA